MEENQKVVRLKDIAEALNTTINTVSHALKDKPDISVQMKEKVKQKAAELGYIPNSVAVSLRNGSTRTIAIAFDNLMNPYYMIMADKITTKLLKMKYATLIYRVENGIFTMDILYKMISRKVDGIICFSEPNEEICEACKKQNIPLVLIGRKNKYVDVSSISSDDITGGYMACKTLIESGCKKVGYLGVPKNIECSRRRKDGFRKYIKENNLPLEKENYIYLDHDNEKVDAYVELLLKRGVDGIFCFNDMMAYEVICYLNNKGLNVPNDIKIVGYDALSENFQFPFEITSITVDKDAVVDKTLSILFDFINRTSYEKQCVEFATHLVAGKSCPV